MGGWRWLVLASAWACVGAPEAPAPASPTDATSSSGLPVEGTPPGLPNPPVAPGTGVTDTGGTAAGGDTAAPPSPLPSFAFVDITASAGVDYLHWNKDPETARTCAWTWLMAGGAAAADFDADGDTDLFAARFDEPSLLFRNRGDGTFDEVHAALGLVTAGKVSSGLWFDPDGDGDLDLLVTRLGVDEGNLLFVQDAGGFTEQASAVGLSLPVATPGGCSRIFSASAADYDGDGDEDVHLAQWNNLEPTEEPTRTVLMRNEGGWFADVTAEAGVDLGPISAFTSGFSDFDADGVLDLWVVADFEQSRVLRGLGDGTFADTTAAWGAGLDTNGMGAAVGDWDGDGDPDWVVTAILPDDLTDCSRPDWGCSGNVLYAGGPNGVFTEQAAVAGVQDGGWAWGAVLGDLDGDGHLDLVHASGEIEGAGWTYGPEAPRVFWNHGAGVATEVATAVGLGPAGLGRSVLLFDADGDGDLDLFHTANADHPHLWRNDAPAAGWLTIAVTGPARGLGARVEVTPEGGAPVQTRWIHANSGFSAVGPPEAHVGLGTAGRADVRVVFPDGAVVESLGVAAGQRWVVAHP
jgi:hypothetical protein